MKFVTFLVCLLSQYALADSISAPFSLEASQKLSIGAEVASASYIGSQNVGESTGVGVLGSYKLNPNFAIQGDMYFSNHVTTYQFWTWYGPYNQLINSNSVALSIGPVYRPTSKKLSPLIGALLSYNHDYDNIPNPYQYGSQTIYGVDSLYTGPMVGLEYRITNDIAIGMDIRYMMNLVSSSNLPAPYSGQTPNYYQAGLNLKFSF